MQPWMMKKDAQQTMRELKELGYTSDRTPP